MALMMSVPRVTKAMKVEVLDMSQPVRWLENSRLTVTIDITSVPVATLTPRTQVPIDLFRPGCQGNSRYTLLIATVSIAAMIYKASKRRISDICRVDSLESSCPMASKKLATRC